MKLRFYLFTTVYKCTTCPFSDTPKYGACSNKNKEIILKGSAYYCIRSEGRQQL